MAGNRMSGIIEHAVLDFAELPPLLPDDASQHYISKTPPKNRSFSDSTPHLSPSPQFKEPAQQQARDDYSLIATPSKLPRRPGTSSGELRLQLPPVDTQQFSKGFAVPFGGREIYGSPSTALPRHSRGLDFARSRTNLHQSIRLDSSPDASPTITQKTFMAPSRRASTYSMNMESPHLGSSLGSDRMRSVTSTNALTSDASSSSSDEDMMQGVDSLSALNTPQPRAADDGFAFTPFGALKVEDQPPLPPAFTDFRKATPRKPQTRSRSNAMRSTYRSTTPEKKSAMEDVQRGFEIFRQAPSRRTQSLSMGTHNLHLTSSNDSGDEGWAVSSTPIVIKRPVTRRSNLLPKPKGFARIRAALQEESAPVDSDSKREAEVLRQVQATFTDFKGAPASAIPPSPSVAARNPTPQNDSSEMSDVDALGVMFGKTSGHEPIADERRRSAGKDFLPKLYNRQQTPEQVPLFLRGRSSTGMSEDMCIDSPAISTPQSSVVSLADVQPLEPKMDDAIAQMSTEHMPMVPSATEVLRKVNKRRRDEDFDPSSIKRRAVSPGLSVQNSPLPGQSPALTQNALLQKPPARENSSVSAISDDLSANSSAFPPPTPVSGMKRTGLQGMTDTNDGLMKMCIE